jgi:hypothetical protein
MGRKGKEVWKVLGRGFADWHGSAPGHSVNGAALERMIPDAEGALVYDAEGADADAFTRHVISGPMLSWDVPAGHVYRFAQPQTCGNWVEDRRLFAEPWNGQELGGFDYVSLDVFEALLRRVPGIRIGRVRRGAVAWEEGQ